MDIYCVRNYGQIVVGAVVAVALVEYVFENELVKTTLMAVLALKLALVRLGLAFGDRYLPRQHWSRPSLVSYKLSQP